MFPRRTKRLAANATRMGRQSLTRMTNGYLFDRNQVRDHGTARKKVALPEALAKFFRPIEGTP